MQYRLILFCLLFVTVFQFCSIFIRLFQNEKLYNSFSSANISSRVIKLKGISDAGNVLCTGGEKYKLLFVKYEVKRLVGVPTL
jgi:hypothetical protein